MFYGQMTELTRRQLTGETEPTPATTLLRKFVAEEFPKDRLKLIASVVNAGSLESFPPLGMYVCVHS